MTIPDSFLLALLANLDRINMNFPRMFIVLFMLYISNVKFLHASEPILSISPESCVANKGWCHTQLNISWQLINDEPVCIQIEEHNTSYCFDSGLNNQKTITVRVNGPIKVSLVASKSEQVIAQKTLNVFIKEYKKRARQRHAWSIIQ